jgi:hypothetical protein
VINQSKKKLVLAISSALTLAACNGGGSGGGSSSPSASASISGVASNDILAAATVCIDLNDNLQCDSNEPSTVTNSTGQFSLTGLNNTDIQDKYLIVEIEGNTTGNSSPGKSNVLVRKLPVSIAASASLTAQSINPFSTLLGATDITLAELAGALGVTEDELSAETYTDNPAVKSLAAIIAAKIAGELESRVTSSAVNNASVLLTGGFLQNIADTLKNETGLTPTALEAALEGVDDAAISLSSVVDASVEVTATNKDGVKLEGVSVLVTAYEAGTNTVLTSTSENNLVVGETDSDGNALINLPEYSQSSIDIDVLLEKEGFVTLTKRFKAIEAGDRIPFSMVMTEENQVTRSTAELFDIPAATAASFATGKPAFTLALVKLKSGEEVVLGGSAAAQAMADSENDVQVGLQIPVNRIDTEKVTALSAGIQGFNPARVQDSQSFPGSFEGIGRATEFSTNGINSEHNNASGASDVNTVVPIISTSFTQIRLEDQDGNEFELASAEAGAAADEDPVIYLRVPEDTYKTITEDVNADVPGIQVPIYVYRSGQGWVMVGLSTLVEWDSTANDNAGGYVPTAATLPLNTGIGQLYGEVKITEGNEWVRWVNIDWPVIVGSEIENFDFKGRLRYKGEQGKRYSGSGFIEFEDGSRQWITVSEGRFEYSQPTTESAAENASLSIWNQYTREYQSFEFDEDTSADNSYVLDPNPGLLDNPFQCTVQGKVTKKGEPAAWHYFNLSALRFNQSVSTNANGEFSSISPCDTEVTFRGEGVQKTFTVNGTVSGDESSDANNIVGLTAIDLPNQAPRVSAWTNNYRLTVPEAGSADVVLTAYGSDVDSESLTYSWVCPGTQASSSYVYSSATRTCSVSADMVPDTNETTYLPWSVTVTDTEGASSTYTSNIVAQVAGRNKAPRITGIQRDNRNLSCARNTEGLLTCRDDLVTGTEPVYKVLATDPDGDTLTFSASTLTVVAPSEPDGRFTTTVETGTTDHTIQVTDVRTETATQKTVSVKLSIKGSANEAPIVYMGLNKFAYIAGVDSNALISASLWDDNTTAQALRSSAQWELMRGEDPVAVSITAEGSQWRLPLTGLSAGTYTLKMTVTDSLNLETTVSRNFTVGSSMAPQITNFTGPSQLALSDLGKLLTPDTTFQARVWDDADLSNLDIKAALMMGETEWPLNIALSGNTITGDFADVAEETLSAGDYTLRVTVTDSDNPAVTRDLNIEMALPNNGTVIIVQ